MSAKDLAQHTAEIGAAALALTGSAAAITIAPFAAPLAALMALGLSRRSTTVETAIARARDAALREIANVPDFGEADIDRACELLTESKREIRIDPQAFASAARAGDPDSRLAEALLQGIDFAPDDSGPRRVLEMTLVSVIRTCRTHDGLQVSITQELLIAAAQDARIQITLLQELLDRIGRYVPPEAVITLASVAEADVTDVKKALQVLAKAVRNYIAPGGTDAGSAVAQALSEVSAENARLVEELRRTRQTTVPVATLLAIARKITPRIEDPDEALRELDSMAVLAEEARARGDAGSNVNASVDATLRRLASLTDKGAIDEAALAADAAVDAAQADLAQLLDASIRQNLLALNAPGAAKRIYEKINMEYSSIHDIFRAIRQTRYKYFISGIKNHLRFDLELSIELSRICVGLADSKIGCSAALDDLGSSQAGLAERIGSVSMLVESIDNFKESAAKRTLFEDNIGWANTQKNLGYGYALLAEWTASEENTDDLWVTIRTR